MHHVIFDTCVWHDLTVSEFSLVPKVARLTDEGKLTIVVPELVRSEWDGGREKIVSQITREIVEARRSAIRLKSYLAETDCTIDWDPVSSLDPVSTGATVSAHRIRAIEALLDAEATIRIPISKKAEAHAIGLALRKNPPFRLRNSMADALIFLATAEWVNTASPDKVIFVTHNTTDFSDDPQGPEDTDHKNRLARELRDLVEENGLRFGVIVGRVLNDIEESVATEAEIERGESIVERARVLDQILGGILYRGGFAAMLDQQKRIREMLSGGAMAEMMEQQKKMREALSGGAIAEMMEQQRKMREALSGGTIAKFLKQQRRIAQLLAGAAATDTPPGAPEESSDQEDRRGSADPGEGGDEDGGDRRDDPGTEG